jgi:hypothetical protein
MLLRLRPGINRISNTVTIATGDDPVWWGTLIIKNPDLVALARKNLSDAEELVAAQKRVVQLVKGSDAQLASARLLLWRLKQRADIHRERYRTLTETPETEN